eukprot:Skav217214  [mRNA]  locus=scaffold143:238478:239491:- [translate_table: standard]
MPPRTCKEVLYYVGHVDAKEGKVSVGIRSFSAKQPPFVLRDADYAVYVVSQRFPSSTPLVFRGPGAGAEFTASGLLVGLSVLGVTGWPWVLQQGVDERLWIEDDRSHFIFADVFAMSSDTLRLEKMNPLARIALWRSREI